MFKVLQAVHCFRLSMDPTDENSQRNSSIRKNHSSVCFRIVCNLGILILDQSCHSLLRIVLSLHQLPWTTDFGAPTQVLRMMCPKYRLGLGSPCFLRHHPKLWDSWQIQLERESSHLDTTNDQLTVTNLHHQPPTTTKSGRSPCPKPGAIRWPNPRKIPRICYLPGPFQFLHIEMIKLAIPESPWSETSNFNFWILRRKTASPSVLCVATKDAACIWQARHRQKSCQDLCWRKSLRSYLMSLEKSSNYLSSPNPPLHIWKRSRCLRSSIKRYQISTGDHHKTPACSRLKGRSTESFEETQLRPLPRETTFAHMRIRGFLGCLGYGKKNIWRNVWHVTLPQYSSEMNHPEKWTVSAL